MEFGVMMIELKKKYGVETTRQRKVYCPKCGSTMIKRESKPWYSNKYWYGCSAFPKCRTIILDNNLKEKHYAKHY